MTPSCFLHFMCRFFMFIMFHQIATVKSTKTIFNCINKRARRLEVCVCVCELVVYMKGCMRLPIFAIKKIENLTPLYRYPSIAMFGYLYKGVLIPVHSWNLSNSLVIPLLGVIEWKRWNCYHIRMSFTRHPFVDRKSPNKDFRSSKECRDFH